MNVIALCCFCLMFVTVSAAKKTAELNAFRLLMLGGILWTGGAVFMRLELFPGPRFWFGLSLVALLSLSALFYLFLHTFTRCSDRLRPALWLTLTALLYVPAARGWFLSPPERVGTSHGVLFLYHIDWRLLVPGAVLLLIGLSTARLFFQAARQQGVRSPGLLLVLLGGVVLLVGTLAQLLLPGNAFPWDALAGICWALLLFYALYKKRLFQMTLATSRGLLVAGLVGTCVGSAAGIVPPLETFLMAAVGLSHRAAAVSASLVLTAWMLLACVLAQRLLGIVFTREADQDRTIRRFATAAQTLDTNCVMQVLAESILKEIPAGRVYICMREGARYVAKYCSAPHGRLDFFVSEDCPCLAFLGEQKGSMVVSEFVNSPEFLALKDEERALLRRLNVACVAALRDGEDMVGLVLLSAKTRGGDFGFSDTDFLETLCSIAPIAIKNAALYEKLYREVRIDPLTGVLNYGSFAKDITEQFETYGAEGLALLFVDLDDFKLFNQLYGTAAGDEALRRTAEVITYSVKDRGTVYRSSGKVFAVLLPEKGDAEARLLAAEIHRRMGGIRPVAGMDDAKALSVSIGICSAPQNAASAKDLRDNADLAVYNAKQGGKDRTLVFHNVNCELRHMTERTRAIVEQVERGDSAYQSAFAMISALTAAIDAKDHYTFAHSQNVAFYAANLAVGASLNDAQVRTVYVAGLLHDIGKISIPEHILNKQGGLSQEEFGIMKDHVNGATEMIRHLPDMDYLIPAALGHHERWDGKGYPRGISGSEIPVSARCLAIADGFDAMTSDRPYRKGLPVEYALEQIEKGAGSQFDPQLALLFVDLIRRSDIPVRERVRE